MAQRFTRRLTGSAEERELWPRPSAQSLLGQAALMVAVISDCWHTSDAIRFTINFAQVAALHRKRLFGDYSISQGCHQMTYVHGREHEFLHDTVDFISSKGRVNREKLRNIYPLGER
ncbi:hypothetical protein AC578_5435 [Pseudocercospora eumusae]|uniref:Uncharacterized protein n=1 Tax=Pseudocercospora eumusae TaxID=321146 RepID=A0A139HK55_9PEZI|nr:hypothetical protein AC578_5435 [Pseudocercospora eumusae]